MMMMMMMMMMKVMDVIIMIHDTGGHMQILYLSGTKVQICSIYIYYWQ